MKSFGSSIIFLMVGWLVLMPISINSQIIDIQVVDSMATYIDSSANLPSLDATWGGEPLDSPYWQVFFIFGDGNYYWRTEPMYSGASLMNPEPPPDEYLTDFEYSFSKTKYKPLALMIDRKTDNPPPSDGAGIMLPIDDTIQVDGSLPMDTTPDKINYYPGTTPYSPPIIDPHPDTPVRVGLEHSHFLKDSCWSAFILPYYPEDMGQLLFFFPEGFYKTPDSVKTYLPNYESTYSFSNANIQALTGYGDLPDNYDGLIIHEIEQNELGYDVTDDGQEELRLFHLLKADILPSDTLIFLTVLASDEPSDLAESNYEVDSAFLGELVNPESDYLIRGPDPNDQHFYVDADTLQMSKGEPKDPNELRVDSVCPCDNDTYVVYFSFRFCNESSFPTTSSSLFIFDLTGGDIGCFEALDPHPDPNIHTINKDGFNGCDAIETRCDFRNFCNGCNSKFCIDYIRIYKNRYTVPDEECRTFYFSAVANKRGWDELQLGNPAVKVCLTFNETYCEQLCKINTGYFENKSTFAWLPDCQDVCEQECSELNVDLVLIGPFYPPIQVWIVWAGLFGFALLYWAFGDKVKLIG